MMRSLARSPLFYIKILTFNRPFDTIWLIDNKIRMVFGHALLIKRDRGTGPMTSQQPPAGEMVLIPDR